MGSDVAALIGLAIDAFACLTFLKVYKWCKVTTDKVKGAKDVEIGPALIHKLQKSPESSIAYGCIQGAVRPVDKALQSQYNPWQEGVIRRMILTEHKSKKLQGIWSEVKKVIQDSTQDVPFLLRNPFNREKDEPRVLVIEPSEANFLMDDLTSTYDKFEPNKLSFMQRVADRIFGDVHEGTHVSEKMLICDTLLLGFGKIALVDGKIQLRPPESGYEYILTQMTKSEVIRKFETKASVFKVLSYLTGFIGAGIVIYLIHKRYKEWKLKREREEFLDNVRTARTERDNRNENGDAGEDNTCVICLANAREVILLNCGHICVCAECVMALPRPIVCPVCRQQVERYLPVYNP